MLKNQIIDQMLNDIIDTIDDNKAAYELPDLKAFAYYTPKELIAPPFAVLNFKNMSINLQTRNYILNLDLVVCIKGLKNVLLEKELVNYLQKLSVLLMENRPKFSEKLNSLNGQPSIIEFEKTSFKGVLIELSYNIIYANNLEILLI